MNSLVCRSAALENLHPTAAGLSNSPSTVQSIRLGLAIVCLLTLAVVPLAHAGEPLFVEMTTDAGLDAVHHGSFYGIGQAWGDVDRDGCVDLYLTDQVGDNTLYRNRCDGTFEPFAFAPVLLGSHASAGAVFADYDNDGWLDLLVTGEGTKLFRNLAGQGFVDVTATSGVGFALQGESATWGDFDKDGHLDLFVVDYRLPDHLFRNRGDGTFEDLSEMLAPEINRPGFANTFLDFDNDGDLDLYVVNDRLFGNLLFRNDGPGCGGWCFENISIASGTHRPVWGMGIATGDYDNDGDLDLYFSSITEMVLLQSQVSQGSPTFLDVSVEAGVTLEAAGWGMVFADFDNDGWLDLYLATFPDDPNEDNRLYRNLGNGTFEDLSAICGASDPGFSMGVASADYDNDGRIDLVLGNWDEGYKLFANRQDDVGASLRVTLEGGGMINRDGIGSRVYVTSDDARTQFQELDGGASIGAGSELALHFGLGTANATDLRVVWPDGFEQLLPAPANGSVHLRDPRLLIDDFESGGFAAWSSAVP